MWNDQSKGQFLQEFLSLLFLMFSKVGYIFSENNKCVQGSAVNYSIKKPHWPTVCFSCPGVQVAHLIMTIHTTFSLVVKYVYFFFSSIISLSLSLSLSFSECIVDRKTALLFFFGATDNRVKMFVWSNAYRTVPSSAFARKLGGMHALFFCIVPIKVSFQDFSSMARGIDV